MITIYKLREAPEPFYCYFKDKDTYAPFNTLPVRPCERQCIRCECYQDGSDDFNPRHLPMHHYTVLICATSVEICTGIIHGYEVYITPNEDILADGFPSGVEVSVYEYWDCHDVVYIPRQS